MNICCETYIYVFFVLEFTTWPQRQHLYYKVTSNAINFQVKAPWDAEVGLSTNPHKWNDYTVLRNILNYFE